ncbi:phage baseplate assembly protein domain-containing protein [Flavisphingomonas formosensis]|uniref:phage baseplate assembly protein domain-containing protein n=1 Tax=Flavisphingomonas formosensis TaxID=861534 RepID=UPI0012FB7E35|nr:phage baseplate assembly protein [Sphingomonas formosensis]
MMRQFWEFVRRGRVTVVDDSDVVQKVQIDEGPMDPDGGRRISDGVIRVAEFGFASSPPVDSDAVLVRLPGNRALSLVVATNHRDSRLRNLQAGDAALYDARGAYVWFKDGEGLIIDAAGQAVTIRNFSSCTIDGDLHVTGDVLSRNGDVSMNGVHDAYNGHTHGGVQAGSDNTDPPTPEA